MALSKFTIVFKDHVTKEQINSYARRVEESGGQVHIRYDSVLKGFAAYLTEQSLTSLQSDDLIDYIKPDDPVTMQ